MTAQHATTTVNYGLSDEAWGSFDGRLRSAIRSNGLKRVIEIGGGANPTFSADEVRDLGLEYTLLDISETELAKAPAGYKTVCADISSRKLNLSGEYDFAFSRMLAEHVPDGEALHRNVSRLLRPGGHALHFFPTLWAPPFIVNRLLPERAADGVLRLVSPARDRYRYGKFPAYYDWCRGPTDRQISRFQGLGYEVAHYDGYFGHPQYYGKLPALQALHLRWCRYLSQHPRPTLTSFAILHLVRH